LALDSPPPAFFILGLLVGGMNPLYGRPEKPYLRRGAVPGL